MSIQRKAVLVKFSAGIGSSFRTTDRSATDEVCKSKQTEAGRAEVKKHLLPKEALQPLKDAIEAARNFHYEKTLLWSDAGDILRVDNYMDYTDGMRRHREKVEAAQDTFLAQWEQFCADAPKALGALHNAADFPTKDKVESRMFFEIKFLPMPSGTDFRVDLSEEEVSEMRAQVDAQIRATIFQPFIAPLRNMVSRLKDPKGIFRNTLVSNIEHLVKLVPPGDPMVDTLAKEIEELTKQDADTLRENKAIRGETATKAEAILERMAAYLPAFASPGPAPQQLPLAA